MKNILVFLFLIPNEGNAYRNYSIDNLLFLVLVRSTVTDPLVVRAKIKIKALSTTHT